MTRNLWLHDRIELNFMLPGHTKFRPDSFFGLFKKHYRRQHSVDDMGDLSRCVRDCTHNVTCIPQLYTDWNYYGWNSFFKRWFLPCTGIASYHTFIFDRQHPSIVKVKESPTDNEIDVNLFKKGVTMIEVLKLHKTNCMPLILYPQGLTDERIQYLYENVREFVHDTGKADNVCPKPVGSLSLTVPKTGEKKKVEENGEEQNPSCHILLHAICAIRNTIAVLLYTLIKKMIIHKD